MPKAKKKLQPAPEGSSGSPGVQWAPISTLNRAAMMPQPPSSRHSSQPPAAQGPAASASSSAFPSPSSEGPPASSSQAINMLRGADLRVHQQPPVLPSNAPPPPQAGQQHHVHHHYIPTPTSSGRGTPVSTSNYGGHPGPGPTHGRAPFPHTSGGGPSSHVLPSIESPGPGPQPKSKSNHTSSSSTGRRTPVVREGMQPPHSSFKYPPPGPPPQHQHQHQQQHTTNSARPSPSQEPSRITTAGSTEPAAARRSLTDDEIRRLQRFMSLDWRVGVMNHPPFARRPQPHPDLGHGHPDGPGPGPGPGPQIAGFVGQSQLFGRGQGVGGKGGAGGQGQRPPR